MLNGHVCREWWLSAKVMVGKLINRYWRTRWLIVNCKVFAIRSSCFFSYCFFLSSIHSHLAQPRGPGPQNRCTLPDSDSGLPVSQAEISEISEQAALQYVRLMVQAASQRQKEAGPGGQWRPGERRCDFAWKEEYVPEQLEPSNILKNTLRPLEVVYWCLHCIFMYFWFCAVSVADHAFTTLSRSFFWVFGSSISARDYQRVDTDMYYYYWINRRKLRN